jgi:mycothiol synthase
MEAIMTTNLNLEQTKKVKSTNKQNKRDTARQESLLNRTTMNLPEGYTLRPATMADIEEAVATFNAASVAKIGKPGFEVEDIKAEWLLPDFDLDKSTRVVARPDGRIAGYIEVWDSDAVPTRIWVWGRVHPEEEGQGIGSLLMEWAEARARQAIPRVPDDIRVAMQVGTFNGYRPAEQLFQDCNMALTRHFWTMVIDVDGQPLQPPLWPESVTVRGMIAGQEERQTIQAVRDSFKDHWGYLEQPFEQEFERWQHFINHDKEFDPSLWFLAMDGEEIAGVALCRLRSHEDPEMGWVNTLGVKRPWRRQGLGLALLQHAFNELQARGQKRVGLGVDAGSLTGATRLYEKAGMHVLRQFDLYEKELRPGRDISTQTVDD